MLKILSNFSPKQKRAFILLLLITPIGFYTKVYSGSGASWVNNSLGGVFYEIFWCLIIFFFFQNSRALMIAVLVFIITCFLEVLQLWHPKFLEIIRVNFIGRTVFGTSFSLHDFIYYFIGSGIGYLILYHLQKLRN